MNLSYAENWHLVLRVLFFYFTCKLHLNSSAWNPALPSQYYWNICQSPTPRTYTFYHLFIQQKLFISTVCQIQIHMRGGRKDSPCLLTFSLVSNICFHTKTLIFASSHTWLLSPYLIFLALLFLFLFLFFASTLSLAFLTACD